MLKISLFFFLRMCLEFLHEPSKDNLLSCDPLCPPLLLQILIDALYIYFTASHSVSFYSCLLDRGHVVMAFIFSSKESLY